MSEHFRQIGGEAYSVDKEFKPLLSAYAEVNVNTYKTRRTHQLEVNGENGIWHSVKGGVEAGPVGIYEILFNPDTNEWLKIVPPLVRNKTKMENLLRKSADISRDILRLSNMHSFAHSVRDVDVSTPYAHTYGYTSPHLGPTVEFMVNQIYAIPTEERAEAKNFISDIYCSSFRLASRAYLEKGIWISDPNPGNVLVNIDGQNVARVTLIDFTSTPQFKDHGLLTGRGKDEARARVRKNVSQLFDKFRKQAINNRISFDRQNEQVRSVFEDLLPNRLEGI